MEKILELIKGEVCMGTYGIVELELRKLVEGQKPTTNSKSMPCHNKTCDACKNGECRFADHLCAIRKYKPKLHEYKRHL